MKWYQHLSKRNGGDEHGAYLELVSLSRAYCSIY